MGFIDCIKILKKFKKNYVIEDLRSYHFKHAIFWIFKNDERYKNKSTYYKILDVLRKLYDVFKEKNFPNFWIQKGNMISNIDEVVNQKILLALLEFIKILEQGQKNSIICSIFSKEEINKFDVFFL